MLIMNYSVCLLYLLTFLTVKELLSLVSFFSLKCMKALPFPIKLNVMNTRSYIPIGGCGFSSIKTENGILREVC